MSKRPRVEMPSEFPASYNAGMCFRDLEQAFGVSNTVIIRWLKLCGFKRRQPSKNLAERWKAICDLAIHENGCWLWPGTLSQSGYGEVKINYKRHSVHRLSWEMTHRSSPGDLLVCHKCDVPRCFNPEHLFLGTGSDNSKDCYQKKRHLKALVTHCVHGHAYDDANTLFQDRGRGRRSRVCRACRQVSIAKTNEKRRQGRDLQNQTQGRRHEI